MGRIGVFLVLAFVAIAGYLFMKNGGSVNPGNVPSGNVPDVAGNAKAFYESPDFYAKFVPIGIIAAALMWAWRRFPVGRYILIGGMVVYLGLVFSGKI